MLSIARLPWTQLRRATTNAPSPKIPSSPSSRPASNLFVNSPHRCGEHSNLTHQKDSYLNYSLLNPTNQLVAEPSRFSCTSDSFYNSLFSHLRSPNNLSEAEKVHGVLVVHGFFLNGRADPKLGAQLVNIYVGYDRLQGALHVLDQLPQKNNFAWNAILRGLVNAGHFSDALEFYHSMLREGSSPDNFTYPLVLKACSGLSALEEGRRVKEAIQFNESRYNVKPNIFVACAMIDMFAKCGSLSEARKIFDGMPSKDLVSWSVMICGAVQNGEWFEALCLYRRMNLEGWRPDSVIVATVLPACGRLGAQHLGMTLQGCAVRRGFADDLYVSNALIDMYCKSGDIHEACRVFCHMINKDAVSWSTLIAGHMQNSEYCDGLMLYLEMKAMGIRSTAVTVASVLPALANLKLLRQGKEMHNYVLRHGLESDTFVGSALIDMYGNCGSMREAGFIFEMMSDRDITIWNSMIVGHVLNGNVDLAFGILRRIKESKLRLNSVSILSILPLCTRMGTLRQGREIHGYATRNSLVSLVSVGNSLIDMYCKCGYLELGLRIFNQMVETDIVTFNTIIVANGIHGHGEQAFSFFDQMRDAGIRPNKVTFIALLSACSHAGLMDRGWFLYNTMVYDCGILPDMEHYACMVDLLGRSGHLDDAWEFIRRMPVEADIDVLGCLLGACRVHNRVELAEQVSRRIFQKNPEDSGYYVLLSNIYASSGRWADAARIRAMLKYKGLLKKAGNSWIQIGCHVHSFRARDRIHPESKRIQEVLESLVLEMKDEGYLLDLSCSFHDITEDDEFEGGMHL
ncbi:putative pentatricopeptide repeat-containing protein At3g01580 [Macadamia integrifolia]|uniref:putative pentatricopeptide repeat-containing protein At3g01580 n=1 Tax=Macadamia integrifolia TaxID=60698 RepID=UPI001C4F6F98|nr:putative pentatricopeptide repeat-containing protein At3g01580 [Macadamia integrifolia]